MNSKKPGRGGLFKAIAGASSLLLMMAGTADAKDIVHDAEFYVLKAQHGDKWASQDKDIDKKPILQTTTVYALAESNQAEIDKMIEDKYMPK